MELAIRKVDDQRFGEGPAGHPLLTCVDDVSKVIEVCLTHALDRVLLYPENLPAAFFDLSSGEAGAILQKLRNYHIRLAVVHAPDLTMSHRFGGMVRDEQRGPYFRLFGDRATAQRWLCAE